MYQGFARKYRPQTFEDVVGQEAIATTLRNAIKHQRVHHAYLFCGSKGVGKTSMARILAKCLNCEKGPVVKPCNQCEICRHINHGDDIDVMEIDGASNRGIDEIRNIRENIKYAPTRARFKIFIIDEVHMLTTAAFNALLKTLEEPPSYAKFIMATTQPYSIPDTILSRCQRFDFNKMQHRHVIQRLQHVVQVEKLRVAPTLLAHIAQVTGGAMRDSLTLLDQLSAFAEQEITPQLLYDMLGRPLTEDLARLTKALAEHDIAAALGLVQDFNHKGGDLTQLLACFRDHLRKLLLINVLGPQHALIEVAPEELASLQAQSRLFNVETLLLILQMVIDTHSKMRRNLAGRILFEMTLIKISRLEQLEPLAAITQRLTKLEQQLREYYQIPGNSQQGNAWGSRGTLSAPPEPGLNHSPLNQPVPDSATDGSQEPNTPAAPPAGKAGLNRPPAGKAGLNHPRSSPKAAADCSQGLGHSTPAAPPAGNTGVKRPCNSPKAVVDGSQDLGPKTPPAPPAGNTGVSHPSRSITTKPPHRSHSKRIAEAAHCCDGRLPVKKPLTRPLAETETAKQPDSEGSTSALWSQALKLLQQHLPRIAPLLQSEVQMSLVNDCLLLRFPSNQQFIMDLLRAPEKKKILEQIVTQVWQRNITVRFELISGARVLKSTRELHAQVDHLPLVKKVLELFDGRILEIRSTDQRQHG